MASNSGLGMDACRDVALKAVFWESPEFFGELFFILQRGKWGYIGVLCSDLTGEMIQFLSFGQAQGDAFNRFHDLTLHLPSLPVKV
jgi:hypothetical protein|mmetsp:Transcript_1238/g.2209  ORF Transcript_1238/g.2209 Transcript_1238/m.2209 type:complete len:86 (-) Transcript_1238:608-865(-)